MNEIGFVFYILSTSKMAAIVVCITLFGMQCYKQNNRKYPSELSTVAVTVRLTDTLYRFDTRHITNFLRFCGIRKKITLNS